MTRSLQPSLMPRDSFYQGLATGLAILTARSASRRTDRIADAITPNETSRPQRIAARAAVGGVGYAMRTLPNPDDTAWPAGVARLTGELLEGAAVGGVVYEVITAAKDRMNQRDGGAARTTLVSTAALAFALYKSRSYLRSRRTFFTAPEDERPLTLPKSLGTAIGVTVAGTALGMAHRSTRRGWQRFFGPGLVRAGIGRAVNEAMWAGLATGLYWAGISYVGQANEKIDPGYAQPPTNPWVSGGPDSLSPFDELGQQGRRFVTDAITPELIESVMKEPAKAHPVRIYVGFNQQPLYPAGRAETALEEMERLGAYDRGTILLVSPTGTGWVDHTMVESAEFFTRGDIATVCIQYGRYPSFLSLQKVRAGRQQFRQLVWGVRQRVRAMPDDKRPKIFVFGESLGAWASSDVIMKLGVEGLDHYGIDRALWFGMPQLARWSAAGLDRPGQLCPPGSVGVFDRWEQFERVSPAQRDAMRIVQLSHDNDPITRLTPTLLYRRPDWLGPVRGRGVPTDQHWYPAVTFIQTLVDAANAMTNVPGDFRSTGHDYRADTARFVAEGYRLPYTEEQLAAVDAVLRSLEKERAERISRPTEAPDVVAPPAHRTPHHARVPHPPKLHGHHTKGANWLESLGELTGYTRVSGTDVHSRPPTPDGTVPSETDPGSQAAASPSRPGR